MVYSLFKNNYEKKKKIQQTFENAFPLEKAKIEWIEKYFIVLVLI